MYWVEQYSSRTQPEPSWKHQAFRAKRKVLAAERSHAVPFGWREGLSQTVLGDQSHAGSPDDSEPGGTLILTYLTCVGGGWDFEKSLTLSKGFRERFNFSLDVFLQIP